MQLTFETDVHKQNTTMIVATMSCATIAAISTLIAASALHKTHSESDGEEEEEGYSAFNNDRESTREEDHARRLKSETVSSHQHESGHSHKDESAHHKSESASHHDEHEEGKKGTTTTTATTATTTTTTATTTSSSAAVATATAMTTSTNSSMMTSPAHKSIKSTKTEIKPISTTATPSSKAPTPLSSPSAAAKKGGHFVKEGKRDEKKDGGKKDDKMEEKNQIKKGDKKDKVEEAIQKVVGYIIFTRDSTMSGNIIKLAVVSDVRNQGVGAALIHRAVAEMKVLKCVSSVLHVDPERKPAVSLYQKAGFAEAALIKNYYIAGRHASVMKLQLLP